MDFQRVHDLCTWISEVSGEEITSFREDLASGRLLCLLMTSALPSGCSVRKFFTADADALPRYLRACRRLGITHTFTVEDVRNGTGMERVLANVEALRRVIRLKQEHARVHYSHRYRRDSVGTESVSAGDAGGPFATPDVRQRCITATGIVVVDAKGKADAAGSVAAPLSASAKKKAARRHSATTVGSAGGSARRFLAKLKSPFSTPRKLFRRGSSSSDAAAGGGGAGAHGDTDGPGATSQPQSREHSPRETLSPVSLSGGDDDDDDDGGGARVPAMYGTPRTAAPPPRRVIPFTPVLPSPMLPTASPSPAPDATPFHAGEDFADLRHLPRYGEHAALYTGDLVGVDYCGIMWLWNYLLQHEPDTLTPPMSDRRRLVRALLRAGVPDTLRGHVWFRVVGAARRMDQAPPRAFARCVLACDDAVRTLAATNLAGDGAAAAVATADSAAAAGGGGGGAVAGSVTSTPGGADAGGGIGPVDSARGTTMSGSSPSAAAAALSSVQLQLNAEQIDKDLLRAMPNLAPLPQFPPEELVRAVTLMELDAESQSSTLAMSGSPRGWPYCCLYFHAGPEQQQHPQHKPGGKRDVAAPRVQPSSPSHAVLSAAASPASQASASPSAAAKGALLVGGVVGTTRIDPDTGLVFVSEASIRRVLLAFCYHCPTIGYWQGLNFVVAMLLRWMGEEEAFWTLVQVVEVLQPRQYYTNMAGAFADQAMLLDLVRLSMPDLTDHITSLGGSGQEPAMVALRWFVCLFTNPFTSQFSARLWDVYVVDGQKALFRCGLAVLRRLSARLLRATNFGELMAILDSAGTTVGTDTDCIPLFFGEGTARADTLFQFASPPPSPMHDGAVDGDGAYCNVAGKSAAQPAVTSPVSPSASVGASKASPSATPRRPRMRAPSVSNDDSGAGGRKPLPPPRPLVRSNSVDSGLGTPLARRLDRPRDDAGVAVSPPPSQRRHGRGDAATPRRRAAFSLADSDASGTPPVPRSGPGFGSPSAASALSRTVLSSTDGAVHGSGSGGGGGGGDGERGSRWSGLDSSAKAALLQWELDRSDVCLPDDGSGLDEPADVSVVVPQDSASSRRVVVDGIDGVPVRMFRLPKESRESDADGSTCRSDRGVASDSIDTVPSELEASPRARRPSRDASGDSGSGGTAATSTTASNATAVTAASAPALAPASAVASSMAAVPSGPPPVMRQARAITKLTAYALWHTSIVRRGGLVWLERQHVSRVLLNTRHRLYMRSAGLRGSSGGDSGGASDGGRPGSFAAAGGWSLPADNAGGDGGDGDSQSLVYWAMWYCDARGVPLPRSLDEEHFRGPPLPSPPAPLTPSSTSTSMTAPHAAAALPLAAAAVPSTTAVHSAAPRSAVAATVGATVPGPASVPAPPGRGNHGSPTVGRNRASLLERHVPVLPHGTLGGMHTRVQCAGRCVDECVCDDEGSRRRSDATVVDWPLDVAGAASAAGPHVVVIENYFRGGDRPLGVA